MLLNRHSLLNVAVPLLIERVKVPLLLNVPDGAAVQQTGVSKVTSLWMSKVPALSTCTFWPKAAVIPPVAVTVVVPLLTRCPVAPMVFAAAPEMVMLAALGIVSCAFSAPPLQSAVPVTVRLFAPPRMPALKLNAATVTFASSVTVSALLIVAVSREPGTPTPPHVAGLLQLPVVVAM